MINKCTTNQAKVARIKNLRIGKLKTRVRIIYGKRQTWKTWRKHLL